MNNRTDYPIRHRPSVVARAVSVAALLVMLSGCDWLESIFGPIGGSTVPRIPAPESYIAEVPLVSEEVIVATVPITNFSPRVTRANDAQGNEIISGVNERVALVINGNPAPSPVVGGRSTPGISVTPHVQVVRYWRRLGSVERYSGATETSITRSVTRGSSTTRSESFGYTLGVSTSISGGGIFASVSTTITAEFSGEFSSEYTVSEETTETQSYTVSADQGDNLVFAVWQLIEEYRIVRQDGTGWSEWEDPRYLVTDADLEPLAIATTELRNISYRFDNTPRVP